MKAFANKGNTSAETEITESQKKKNETNHRISSMEVDVQNISLVQPGSLIISTENNTLIVYV